MRAKTFAPKELRRLSRQHEDGDAPVEPRPATRAECIDAPRPCPWVSCKHHLYLDVNPETGSIKLNFPDLEVWEMTDSCSLDVADRNGVTLEKIGEIMNLTRERIRQIEVQVMVKARAHAQAAGLEP